MKYTNYFKSFLFLGILFLAFSFADANAKTTSGNTVPVKTYSDTSITSDNYIPHFKKHPRHHRRWWRRHHRRRRHW